MIKNSVKALNENIEYFFLFKKQIVENKRSESKRGNSVGWMVIWKLRGSIHIRPLIEQNGTTDKDEPTTILNRTKAEDRKDNFDITLHQWSLTGRSWGLKAPKIIPEIYHIIVKYWQQDRDSKLATSGTIGYVIWIKFQSSIEDCPSHVSLPRQIRVPPWSFTNLWRTR